MGNSKSDDLEGTLGGFSRELPKRLGYFKKARGKWDSARYNALNILKNVQDLSKYDEPHRRMIRKLQEVWQGLTTWEEQYGGL